MKKLFALVLLFPSVASAQSSSCEPLGLYAFSLTGCFESTLGVNTKTPLCEQEQWKHLAYYDSRCFVPVPFDWSRSDWDAPAPYQKVSREPISGKVVINWGSYQEADWNYRACRQTLGTLKKKRK